jgi:hypothetical protein
MSDDVQAAFDAGFRAENGANPFLFSSDCWIAFQAGLRWWNSGARETTTCRKTRGHAVRLGDGSIYTLTGGVVIQTQRGAS